MSFDILGLWQQKIVSLLCLSPLLRICQFDATKPTNALDGMFGPKPALGEKGEALQTTFSSNDSVLTFFDIFQYSAAIFVTFLVILF